MKTFPRNVMRQVTERPYGLRVGPSRPFPPAKEYCPTCRCKVTVHRINREVNACDRCGDHTRILDQSDKLTAAVYGG